jgi:hypothetical protein
VPGFLGTVPTGAEDGVLLILLVTGQISCSPAFLVAGNSAAFARLACLAWRIAGTFSKLPAEKGDTNPTLQRAGLDLEANLCPVMAPG